MFNVVITVNTMYPISLVYQELTSARPILLSSLVNCIKGNIANGREKVSMTWLIINKLLISLSPLTDANITAGTIATDLVNKRR